MSLSIGSATVGLTPTQLPLSAPSPGSLVLSWTGANPITFGGPGVAAGGVGAGQATYPANSVIPLAKVGGVAPGSIYAITTSAPGTLNWLYGTDVNS